MSVAAPFRLAIHGGAGVISRCDLSAEMQAQYEDALRQALLAGHRVLAAEGTALDAVQAAVQALEDCPLFNAGKGAVFTHDGRVEMDASIMCGRSGQAGGVAAVHVLRNPIAAARLVMDQSPHVLLCGDGAEKFAIAHGARTEEAAYFHTDRRWTQLQQLISEEQIAADLHASASIGISGAAFMPPVALDHSVRVADERVDAAPSGNAAAAGPDGFPVDHKSKFGTVGAVALDAHGNIAAATSTGGMSNKRWGRVGDTPIVGAGTFASNATCAVSCTGHGEFFIRNVVAYRVAAIMEYGGAGVEAAAARVVHQVLKEVGGEGGLIAIDRAGTVTMPFNSEGMYRGQVGPDGQCHVAIFGDDK